jgi:hypothetical protein
MSDLAHMHFILEVADLSSSVEKLKQQGAEVVSPQPVNLPDAYRYSQGCLIRDSDRHAMLLVM